MAIFLKSAESKLALLTMDKEIDNAIEFMPINEVIKKYSSLDQLQYILYRYSDLINEDVLLKLLKFKDIYVSFKSFSLLTELYKTNDHKKDYVIFFKYMLMEDLTYEEKNHLLSLFVIFISCKSLLSFNLEKRKTEILYDESCISILKKMISVKKLQYNILLILYVFSFTEEYTDRVVCFFMKNLISILKDRSREKILRICYSVIVNILKSNYKLSINQIYELRKVTTNLCETNISDENLVANIKISKNILNIKHAEYTIDNYTSDLFKEILEDHDYHYDEVFWHVGLPTILKNSVEIIKILKKYLKSHNNDWICLACNDIYMLIKVYPKLYSLISKHKVRDVLFELTKSENDEVRFKAIQALYACIFSEWN